MNLSKDELLRRVSSLFQKQGEDSTTADAVAAAIVAAEHDGTYSHGLARLPAYLSTLQSGWVGPAAPMKVIDAAPGVARVNAANDFAQGALARVADLAFAKARSQGIACIVRSVQAACEGPQTWPQTPAR